MREERMHGIESESRNRLPVDSIRIFNEMKVYSKEVFLEITKLMEGSRLLCTCKNFSRQQKQSTSRSCNLSVQRYNPPSNRRQIQNISYIRLCLSDRRFIGRCNSCFTYFRIQRSRCSICMDVESIEY